MKNDFTSFLFSAECIGFLLTIIGLCVLFYGLYYGPIMPKVVGTCMVAVVSIAMVRKARKYSACKQYNPKV